MRINKMLNDVRLKTVEDLNELPLWALNDYCERHRASIIVKNGRLIGLNSQKLIFTQKTRVF